VYYSCIWCVKVYEVLFTVGWRRGVVVSGVRRMSGYPGPTHSWTAGNSVCGYNETEANLQRIFNSCIKSTT